VDDTICGKGIQAKYLALNETREVYWEEEPFAGVGVYLELTCFSDY
jgi:hypothetical protein